MKHKRILKIALAALTLASILASCTPASTTATSTTSGLLTTTTTRATTTTTSLAISSTTTAQSIKKPTTKIDPAIGAVLIFEDNFKLRVLQMLWLSSPSILSFTTQLINVSRTGSLYSESLHYLNQV